MTSPQARRPVVAANWKMNTGPDDGAALARAVAAESLPFAQVDVVLCPPATGLAAVVAAVQGTPVAVGAQHVFWEESGAYTGEISVPMLEGLATYAVAGHSERRQLFGETDLDVQRKTLAILSGGLTPIVAVGESLDQRDAGETLGVLRSQVTRVFEALTPAETAACVIAYEPVWAIGTGRNATPEQAQEAIGWIRDIVAAVQGLQAAELVRIQYGGSVSPENCQELLCRDGIDGALVGGASLDAGKFAAIVQAAAP
ncbi:MAG: triose-phosphate isomerase [Chloroflexota bacterium]|nr:triose-phosphate isomerase [Chloroflexota bacterium]MDE2919942.1 triose-phosphate isomerase [Chloroflexota bacterium]